MYFNTIDAEKLLAEGSACLGMLSEARVKCVLLKQNPFHGTKKELSLRISQISSDIDKYSNRLQKICEELKDYVTTEEMV